MRKPIDIEIFVIDDDKDTTDVISIILENNNIKNVRIFNDPDELLAALNDNVHICVVDYYLGKKINGLELIKKIVKINRHCWFIMLSGQGESKVIIDYVNSVYGSRYIDKGDPELTLNVTLVNYIKDISAQINFIDNFYYTATRINKKFDDLKKAIKGDES